MKKVLQRVMLVLSILAFNALAFAAEQGTAAEASTMVKKGIAYLKANGKEKALAEASNSKGQFIDRDLYLSVYDLNGKVVAHGTNPRLIGKDVLELRDADGKYFMKEILSKAKTDGYGWVDYKWVNPVTKEIQAKSAYLERADDLIFASGFYKK